MIIIIHLDIYLIKRDLVFDSFQTIKTEKIFDAINIFCIKKVDGALEGGKKIPLLDIGAGVYPTTLFFNHSCTPNTLRINQGTRVRNTDRLKQ